MIIPSNNDWPQKPYRVEEGKFVTGDTSKESASRSSPLQPVPNDPDEIFALALAYQEEMRHKKERAEQRFKAAYSNFINKIKEQIKQLENARGNKAVTGNVPGRRAIKIFLSHVVNAILEARSASAYLHGLQKPPEIPEIQPLQSLDNYHEMVIHCEPCADSAWSKLQSQCGACDTFKEVVECLKLTKKCICSCPEYVEYRDRCDQCEFRSKKSIASYVALSQIKGPGGISVTRECLPRDFPEILEDFASELDRHTGWMPSFEDVYAIEKSKRSQNAASKGGEKPKKLPAIEAFADEMRRKKPPGSARELWNLALNSYPSNTPFMHDDCEVYRDGDELVHARKERETVIGFTAIGFDAFRRTYLKRKREK